ncbi:MAG TPA: hypothetical protein VEF06_04105 [Bryobacteraceae bacterium]|nr:hypothetical protein [Bryobacteraceae bacterium]
MKRRENFADLVADLSRDPEVRRAVARARRRKPGKEVARVENVAGIVMLLMGIASRFAKKKRARALEEAMDVIYLLIQVSIVLKENIFDRPEVKKFFSRSFRQVYALAEELVAMVLPERKGARTRRALRSV